MPKGGKTYLRFDGALLDEFKLAHVVWKAKDTRDDLPVEAAKKFKAGYPRTISCSKTRSGHYDLVILNLEFVSAHAAETVKNRNFRLEQDKNALPLQAVVEFKLDNLGWSNGRTKGVQAEMGKLVLSQEDVELRYLVAVMRYKAPNDNRWKNIGRKWNKLHSSGARQKVSSQLDGFP